MIITYRGTRVLIEKMQDSTHFKMNGRAYHVGEMRSKELSDDLYKWLSDLLSDEYLENKIY